MKCLVLAGGKGERLWPLSRNNFPKQFIKVQKNHSIFQETIARNLAYCDEFIIVTNAIYQSIIANQMETFQGVPYRCVFEEEPRRTTAAITLACFSLQPSEYVFVVAADHLIDTGECKGLSYKESILKAKEAAKKGRIVLFGVKAREINARFGYFTGDGNLFIEKPDRKSAKILESEKDVYQNLGMMLFQNGTFLNEIKSLQPDIFSQCTEAFSKGTPCPEGVHYSWDVLSKIEPISVEHSVIEPTEKKTGLAIGFRWDDIGSLEDLSKTELSSEGVGVVNEGANSLIVNHSPHQAVVVNDLDNVLVVNTTDAVYVGRRGKSYLLKEILHDHPELEQYNDHGPLNYRPWGYYEQLTEEVGYRVRRVVLLPGKTIYEHSHENRSESWNVVQGSAWISLNGSGRTYTTPETITIPAGEMHQISNFSDDPVIFIETAVGDVLHGGDLPSERTSDLTESGVGIQVDPIVKLKPAFKDYLWGGTKLRDLFGKDCDYDVIAESWELSAHPAGNSIVASGRHKGLSFSRYLEQVGKEVLGWKCRPMQNFPLLIKFIDAKQNLSVQVHPNDDYALEKEDEYGKNEMWYVVDTEPGAGLYVGFNRETNREEVEQRVADGSIMHILNFYPTKPGDIFFIPAGTVHAVGAGNLICEIQQSSNSTYRLYDYSRRDKFGNSRPLHLQKALDVLNYDRYQPADFEISQVDNDQKQVRCKYFEVSILRVEDNKKIPLEDDSFQSVTCIAGEGTLCMGNEWQTFHLGESFFIPARNDKLQVTGICSLILTKV